MRALLLAAGLGTRLRPITDTLAKCLVPIQGEPLLGYWLTLLFEGGIERVLINTHYYAEQVVTFVDQSPWRDNIDIVYEDELLGTGGTLLKNRDYFGGESLLLAHADNLTRFDLKAFIDCHTHRPDGVAITMMTFDTDVPEQCGIVQTNDDNIVVAFHEKSNVFHGTRANAAVYILAPSVVDFLTTLNKSVIDMSTEVLPHYIGRMQIYHNNDYHRDIGTPQSLARAQLEF